MNLHASDTSAYPTSEFPTDYTPIVELHKKVHEQTTSLE